MSLTKSDLSAIGKLFDNKFDQKFNQKIGPVGKTMAMIEKKLNKIEKKLDTTIGFFDGEVLKLGKRVDRLETHVGLPPFPIES